jgi:hypothetical protein
MAAITGSSLGYAGAVTELTGIDLWNRIGASKYGVAGGDDLKVSKTTGDRMLLVASGVAWGHNIQDTLETSLSVQLSSVASGSRWDLIVVRRDVTAKSTIEVVQGNAERKLPSLTSTEASHPDQPLALCRVVAGSTTVEEIIDLRCWAFAGGAEAADLLALTYLAAPGAAVKVGQTVHRYEIQSNGVWGWGGYPLNVPRHAEFVYSFTALSGVNHGIDGGVTFDTVRSINGGFASLPGGFLTVATEGVYSVSFHNEWGGGASDSYFLALLHPDGETMASVNASTGAGSTSLGSQTFYFAPGTSYPGNRLALRIRQNSGGNRAVKGRIKVTKIS